MLAESGDSPVQLREKVSSPGGTTITALAELDQRAVRAAMVHMPIQSGRIHAALPFTPPQSRMSLITACAP